jgi:hypothetical protein
MNEAKIWVGGHITLKLIWFIIFPIPYECNNSSVVFAFAMNCFFDKKRNRAQ